MQKQLLVALLMVTSLFAQAQKPGEEGVKASPKQEDKNPSFKRFSCRVECETAHQFQASLSTKNR